MSEIIASVSGVRGIIGDNLTPENIIRFTSAFAKYCKQKSKKNKIIVGRDGRFFGDVVTGLVLDTLLMCGFEVVYIDVAPTPTVQIATENLNSLGGISVTASHNPQQWNGLKFLNPDGTFLDENEIKKVIAYSNEKNFSYSAIGNLKEVVSDSSWIKRHLDLVLKLKLLIKENIRKKKFKVVVDAVNSSGSVIIPELLESLGCRVIKLFCDKSGKFPHTPEPLPGNLRFLCSAVKKHKADFGVAIDPDADRLVLITEKGEPFGEENTITAVTNFVLRKAKSKNKNVTVNLSTTRAVDDIAAKYGANVLRTPVGEINVVKGMMKNNSVIGGEGSGGVIFPELHYGRDSIVGLALILNEFADFNGTVSEYKSSLPKYFIAKTKIENIKNPEKIFNDIKKIYSGEYNPLKISEDDGLKIDLENCWIHLRKSNTEPIIRIISEAKSQSEAEKILEELKEKIRQK